MAAADPVKSRWVYRYQHFNNIGVAVPLGVPSLVAPHPPTLRQLSFVLERAPDPLIRTPPRLQHASVAVVRSDTGTEVTGGGGGEVRVRLTEGWPQLLGREALNPEALSISRQHIVLAYTGEHLYVLRWGLVKIDSNARFQPSNPVYYHHNIIIIMSSSTTMLMTECYHPAVSSDGWLWLRMGSLNIYYESKAETR